MIKSIYMGKEDIRQKEGPIPSAGNNDIVIKNIYSSICGTDVAVYKYGNKTGHKIESGQEFGHETISQVVEVGKNVRGLEVGEYVYPYPRFAKDDTKRAGTLGAFSEYILVPNCILSKSVYKLKMSIDLKEACLIEPFTVGCRAARRSEPKPGESAVIFGAGTIGIAAAISLKFFGIEKIMMIDISDFRLNKCKELGFEICNRASENAKEKMIEYFGNANSIHGITGNVDIFIDCAGADDIIPTYQSYGKIESRLVVVAVNKGIKGVDILDLTYSQHAIIGSGGYMPEDVRDVMKIMASKKYDIKSIITDEYSIKDLPKAIEKAGQTDKAFNVIIDFSK